MHKREKKLLASGEEKAHLTINNLIIFTFAVVTGARNGFDCRLWGCFDAFSRGSTY